MKKVTEKKRGYWYDRNLVVLTWMPAFTGIDRIGDANQITLALSTRFIDQETGQEKLRASIGQIYYFRDRKVMLCGAQGRIFICHADPAKLAHGRRLDI